MPTHVEPVACIHGPDAELDFWPLPTDTFIEGCPNARGFVMSRSPDDTILRGIWEVDPSIFRFTFEADETIVMLKGRLTVAVDDGPTIDLKPGDVAFFAEGTPTTFTVYETARKFFHAASDAAIVIPT